MPVDAVQIHIGTMQHCDLLSAYCHAEEEQLKGLSLHIY